MIMKDAGRMVDGQCTSPAWNTRMPNLTGWRTDMDIRIDFEALKEWTASQKSNVYVACSREDPGWRVHTSGWIDGLNAQAAASGHRAYQGASRRLEGSEKESSTMARRSISRRWWRRAPSKSLHRVLSPKGNPSMDNLAAIFDTIWNSLNVNLKARSVTLRKVAYAAWSTTSRASRPRNLRWDDVLPKIPISA
jgi:hypothetical protein